MLLPVLVVLCPVLKQLSVSDLAPLLTLQQLSEIESNAAAGRCYSLHLAGEHWTGLGWARLCAREAPVFCMVVTFCIITG